MWYVVVDDHGNVINIDSTCHNICGYKYIDLSTLELEHNIITLFLIQIGVHFSAVDVLAA